MKPWCLALLACLLCLAGPSHANQGGIEKKFEDAFEIQTSLLRPCEKNLGYDCLRVDVRLQLDAPIETVWQVITDYQNASKFISNLKSSSEIPLGPNLVQIEQIGRVGWAAMNLEIKTIYKVNLFPIDKKIVSVAIGGDLKTVSMTTQLKANPNGATLLEYSMVTDPGPWAPLSIAEGIITRQARQSFADLTLEIFRRKNAKP
jgi:carbon monoxide dehydrogenase subunit G